MNSIRNIFACLVHENQECVFDLVRNLRFLDSSSPVLLYNGGDNPELLNHNLPLERYAVVVHPSPRRLAWGRLHDFALDCMRFALDHFTFDTLTIVDSDQLGTRADYSGHLCRFLEERPRVGLLGSSPAPLPRNTPIGPAQAAFKELDLWQPFLQRFPEGKQKFVHWSFWPSTVFTANAARELTQLFTDPQLQAIMQRTRIWASEEVILPTLVALLGFEIAASPFSYDYVKYRAIYTLPQIDAALARPDVFWIHPILRRYEDKLRKRIREKLNHYEISQRGGATMSNPQPKGDPGLLLTLPILEQMRKIQGWLEEEEADLLIASAASALQTLPKDATVVEVGSFCGRSTVVLGSVVRALCVETKVYAIDPHDGKVGALDQAIQSLPPTLEKFRRNIADAALGGVVEAISKRSFEVVWDKPIGFLLIDGLHDYPNVARDFYHFEPWIVAGGYVAFHDYADYYPGVKAFVNEILGTGRYQKIHCARSLMALKKRPEEAADSEKRPSFSETKIEPGRCSAGAGGLAAVSAAAAPGPLVSCIMPTADRRAFVPQAILYFLRQDYPRRELIIVDDGKDPISDLIPPDPRIRCVRLEGKRTVGAKRNLACEMAQGDLIAHWDDDDWVADWRLSYQIRALLEQPQTDLCGLAQVLFYEPPSKRAWVYSYPHGQRFWAAGSTLCYRRTLWQRHSFPDLNEGEDTVFVWGLTGASVVALRDHTFFVAIVHPHNTSRKRTESPGWQPIPGLQIRRLLNNDWLFYEALDLESQSHGSPGARTNATLPCWRTDLS